ncbi:MAG: hypothetical protein EP347_05545 [Alphaproteobacteria bacterium]|nr:MAG: hypothetical protein EP347_05545 [Alphaproteobacteria bacterium]
MPYEVTWVVTDGRKGMENQCLGLAEAVGLPIEVKHIHPGAPWKWLPESLFGHPWPAPFMALGGDSDNIAAPWPRLWIACGRLTVAYSAAVKKRSAGGTFVVQCQDPRLNPNYFDLVVPPLHDGLTGDNVLPILGSPNIVTPQRLAEAADAFRETFADLPRPLATVLIGGPSHHYKMTGAVVNRLIFELKELKKQGTGLAITCSRRTPPQVREAIRAQLSGSGTYFWDGSDPNPYLGMLALADHILVTEDSTNMVTEAAGTGKPVHVIRLEGGSPKFDTFHRQMIARDITRPFHGDLETWHYEPLQETQKVAEEIKKRLNL